MMSESNKQQAVNKLTEIVANFTAMISTRMPDDVVDKLKQLKDAETSSMGKIIYHTMFDNMQKAIDLNRPACQDTGEIMFFVKVGSRFPLLGELQSILKQAVEEATVKAPLRHNAVEIFDEVNTGKNTGSGVPWVTWDIIPDNDDAEIEVYMAGGGCTLPGRSKVLMPSEGYEGVVKFVFENISTLAVNACPRYWWAWASPPRWKPPPYSRVKPFCVRLAAAIPIQKRQSWSYAWKKDSTVWGLVHKG